MVDVTPGNTWMSGKFSKADGKIDQAIVFIDDPLLHSQTQEQHLTTLDVVTTRLSENHTKINLSKYCFLEKQKLVISFFALKLTNLGHF
jgi:hypothetical protein